MKSETELLKIRFERERAARLEAEKLLEIKSLELFQKNKELKDSNLILETLISERTKKLSEAEKEYEFLVETINDMIFRLDLKGNINFVNQVVTKILGKTKPELAGKSIFELLPTKYSKKIKFHFLRQFIIKNCLSSFEFPFSNTLNEQIWIRLNVHFSSEKCKLCPQKKDTFLNSKHKLKAKNECVFNEIIIVAHDITSQKQAFARKSGGGEPARIDPAAPKRKTPPPGKGGGVSVTLSARRPAAYAAIAAVRFSETLSRKPSVVSHCCSGPTSRARSLVMKPASTVSTQTFSRVAANLASSALSSSLARWARPRVQAKIEAMELVEVDWPFWCWR